MQADERITWVRDEPNRKIVQIIEPTPDGFSVTTEWWDNGEKVRQDCEVSIRTAFSNGKAKEM